MHSLIITLPSGLYSPLKRLITNGTLIVLYKLVIYEVLLIVEANISPTLVLDKGNKYTSINQVLEIMYKVSLINANRCRYLGM